MSVELFSSDDLDEDIEDLDSEHNDAAEESTSSMPTAATAVGMLFVLAGVLLGFRSLVDNSFFTHLQTGRLILSDGFFSNDPYTFTSASSDEWVVQSWFASIVYAVLERVGGGVAIQIVRAITTGALAWLAWDLSSSVGSESPEHDSGTTTILARLAAVVPAVLVGIIAWSERPLIFSLVFLALTLRTANRDVSPKPLAVVGLLWIWMHGSFPLGVALLGALAVGARLDGRRPVRELKALGWLTLGIVVGGAANPFGLKLLWFPIALLQRGEVLGHIREWKPLHPSYHIAQLFLVGAALMLVALVRLRSFRAAAAGLLFLVAAVMSIRNITVATIVFIPIIAEGFRGVGATPDSRRSEWTEKTTVLAAVGIVFISLASIFTQPTWNVERYPIDALDWLETENILDTDDPVRFAHPDYVGNFIELRYDAKVPTYIDDRYEFHSLELVNDYLSLFFAEDDWEAALDRYDIDIVLWEENTSLADALEDNPSWDLIHEEGDWIISCRNNACDPTS